MPHPPFYLQAWENKIFCSFTCGAACLVLSQDMDQMAAASSWLEKTAPPDELSADTVQYRIRVYKSLTDFTPYTMWDLRGIKTQGKIINTEWQQEILKFAVRGHVEIDASPKWIIFHAGPNSGLALNTIVHQMTGVYCYGAVRMIRL